MDNNQRPASINVSMDLADALFGYLSSKPFREVAQLIKDLETKSIPVHNPPNAEQPIPEVKE